MNLRKHVVLRICLLWGKIFLVLYILNEDQHFTEATEAKDDCDSVKFTEFLGGKYHVGDKSMTWMEAHKCCIKKRLRLISLETEDESNSLAHEFDHNQKLDKTAELWTSAQSISGLHIWTSIGQALKNYTSWAPDQPSSSTRKDGKKECVIAKPNGTDSILWSDERCDKTCLVVCERHPGCKDGPADRIRKMEVKDATDIELEGSQYAFANEKKSWTEGYRYCRQQGLQLISLERQSKNEHIVELWTSKRKDSFWTSGTEVGRYDKHFYWATLGKEFGYHGFEILPLPRRDKKNCILVQTNKNGSWIDEDCWKKYGIICEPYTSCEGCA